MESVLAIWHVMSQGMMRGGWSPMQVPHPSASHEVVAAICERLQ